MSISAITQNLTTSTIKSGNDLPQVGGQDLPLSDSKQNLRSEETDKVSLHVSNSLERITKGYDVRNITPREMSELSKNLYENGAISFQDHALMSFQPELGMGMIPGENDTSAADIPKDFIQHWERQLEYHKQQGNESFAKIDQRILNILSNLSEISGWSNA